MKESSEEPTELLWVGYTGKEGRRTELRENTRVHKAHGRKKIKYAMKYVREEPIELVWIHE